MRVERLIERSRSRSGKSKKRFFRIKRTSRYNVDFAPHLLKRGLSLRHIQALLGHTNPTTTARYAHLTSVTEQDSWKTIDDLVNTLQIRIAVV
ncbi:MAG: tyrosine-type recombinase/integrase [Desulfobulbaceae bacterium]|nr:tyrosine-type recombinase/integrase [Desulfobulbaceae bacterium]